MLQNILIMENSYSKNFKYTLKNKEGKIYVQEIVSFGSKEQPFPKDWETNPRAIMFLSDYKEEFIRNNLEIDVDSENLEFDI